MEKINVFDVQVPDGRQIRCMSYNKVTYFDLDDICKLCFSSYDLHDVADTKVITGDGRDLEASNYTGVNWYIITFDFVVYPLKLIITVGLDYETLCNRFENMEPDHKGEWGDKDDMDKEASFVNLVKDRDDDGRFAILWNFSSDDDITIKNTCHESFHVAMSVCQFCNMSLGFKVGEDEHAAYIAGFAGGCAYDFLYSNSTE